ncbi:flagellin hook IN motif-containing protein, partial [Campylobacter sp. P0109]
MINGVTIGNITVKANDSDNALIAAINAKKDETGVEA